MAKHNKQRQYLKIKKVKELAYQLSVEPKNLIEVADQINILYDQFTFTDKKGKMREAYNAEPRLKHIHKKINKLLNNLQYPLSIQGGIKNRSVVTNARQHCGKKYVANFDIKNFFPSVDFHIVYHSFILQKCTPAVSRLLTRLTTVDKHLPQGFATSPKISGLILFEIDQRLKELLGRYNLVHSFWIDDLTVSGDYPIDQIKNKIIKIFSDYGFTIHKDKEKQKIMNSSKKQTCTKLIVNIDLNVEKNLRVKLRKVLHICLKYGVENYLNKNSIPVTREQFINTLRGKLSYVCSVNKKNIYLRKMYDEIILNEYE